MFVFTIGFAAMFLAMAVAGFLASAGHAVAAYAVLAAGVVVLWILVLSGKRADRRRKAEMPLAIRQERDGAVVVGPVHPAGAEARASVNPARLDDHPGSDAAAAEGSDRARLGQGIPAQRPRPPHV
jgi:hypothetical protein